MVWEGFDGTDSEIYYTPAHAVSPTDTTGPITSNIVVHDRPPYTRTIIVTATVNDSMTGGSTIKAAEYFIDTKGPNGKGKSMSALDGAFNSPRETVQAVVYLTPLSPGMHIIYFHGKDEQGNWGLFYYVYFNVQYQGAE